MKHTNITLASDTNVAIVALDDLKVDPLNPRGKRGDDHVQKIADSIRKVGLIQPLNVIQRNDHIGVVAGGTRLLALQFLVKEGLSQFENVPVVFAEDEQQAKEWAAVEQTLSVAFSAYELIVAFGDIMQSRGSLQDICLAYGVTETYARKMLKIAGLPKQVLTALKNEKITIEQAQIFTLAPSAKRATAVLKELLSDDNPYHSKYLLKKAFVEHDMDGDSRVAVFVGLEAYKEAGGTVTADLFSDGSDALINDPELMNTLFVSKLEEEARRLQEEEGFKWVDIVTDDCHIYYDHFGKSFKRTDFQINERTEAEEAELEALEELEVLTCEQQARVVELEAIEEPFYSADHKALSGVAICVSYHGSLVVSQAHVAKDDWAAAIEAGAISKPEVSKTSVNVEKPKFSNALIDDLKAIRLASTQRAIHSKMELMLDLLAFQVSDESDAYFDAFNITVHHTRNEPSFEEGFVPATRTHLTGQSAEYTKLSDPKKAAKAFVKFQKKGKKIRNEILAECLAQVYDCDRLDDHISDLLSPSMRDVWTPTKVNFFKRVSTDVLKEVYAEVMGNAASAEFAKLKKGQMADDLHAKFNDENVRSTLPKEVLTRIDQWIPQGF